MKPRSKLDRPGTGLADFPLTIKQVRAMTRKVRRIEAKRGAQRAAELAIALSADTLPQEER